MPSCSTATNPRGIQITFDEATHKYSSIINGKELTYMSGTTFVGKFFKPFDADKIAPFVAKKRGITAEQVKEEWRINGKNAADYGTHCHEVCEDTILDRPLRRTPLDEKEDLTFKNAIKIASAIRLKYEVVGVEKIVFDDRLKIAGTIDLLCRSKDQYNLFYIFDWKTNKELSGENKYNNFALDPISHMADTNLDHYALQLNLYQYILQFGGYVPKNTIFKRVLFHLTPEKVEKFELPDRQLEIRDMMIWNMCN